MQNYIKGLREYLETNMSEFTDNVHFLRVPKEKDSRPLIIFTEIGVQNPYQGGEGGQDVFEVLIEFVVKYEDSVIGRQMREKCKVIFADFNGALGTDWYGSVGYLGDVDIGYDDVNDVVRRGSTYILKSKRYFTT